MEEIVSLNELKEDLIPELIEKIKESTDIMFKNGCYVKSDKKIREDLEEIKEEIKQGKSYFRILIEDGKIRGMYYLLLNDREKFLEPFFETEIFYSTSPRTFFKILNDAGESLKKLKDRFPHVKQYIAYYTTDEKAEVLSHGKIANRKIKRILGADSEKDIFYTFIISSKS